GENGFSTSLTMFTTLAAINAAGYDAGMDSPLNQRYQIRSQIRDILAKEKIPCLSELRVFYKEHKQPTDAGDLNQYISFALVSGDAPKFELPNGAVPPDVEPLRPLSQILADFYQQANIADLWRRSQPAYNAAISQYQDPVINALFEANGYLRNPSGYLGRRFQIFLDLLGAPNQIQVRSYRDDYFVVITTTTAPPVDEIRDAYLGFMLDPLTFKYSETIKQKKPLQKYAEEAPALDLAYKDDFSLLLNKCLVKAIDARLMHESAEKRQEFVNEAMREGFILTAAFADLLLAYEKQQDAFRLYYGDLINAIDVKKEEKRLRTVQFVQSIPQKVIAPPAKIQLDPADESLETAQGLLDQNDIENARKAFKKVFEQTSDKTKQGRAYYGLAVIDLQEKHWDEAVDLFQRTVDSNTSPAIVAWSHYYLGQLALKAGDTEKATAHFKQTLANQAASSKARDAAEKALQSISGEVKQ
ncbi:MAG: tetratricopeptide repeat protein, partial [Acidobacteriaceae bacterium]|nr:tetratricopeptide repeat protein [Acidobacteriaceae bacterium]